jgi:diacylglycerol kinase family enzyme
MTDPRITQHTAETRRIHVLLNHRSGTAAKEQIAKQISDYFTSRGWRVQVVIAQTGTELLSAAGTAAESDAGIVVAGGGDGTISAVATRLIATNKVLGVLPLGTFNYFARRFDVPLDLEGALEVIATGTPTSADVGEVNGRIFLNNSSIGLYPAVLQQREMTYRNLGRNRAVAYASAALALIEPPAVLNLQLEIDGVRLARRTPLLFVGTNEYQMQSLGIPGRQCVRGARLAAYITRPLGVVTLWRLALRALLRGLHGASELEVVCARELRVSLRRRTARVALDGEVLTLETPLQFRMRPRALTVLAGTAAESSKEPQ